MDEPISTAELLRSDLARHSPMMVQYLGVTSFVNGDKSISHFVNLTVPS